MSVDVREKPVTAHSSLRFKPKWRNYFQMTKPTISLLVVVTVVPTLFMAAGDEGLSMATLLFALVGTYMASSSAGMFNHLVDSDIDSHMNRTKKRPLPSGSVARTSAAWLASGLAVLSFGLLYFGASPLAAWTALAANAFYVVVYTMYLKPRTVQNIVIGGAAGSVGPLIGWAAVTNQFAWPAWALFLIIFLWTPPHFWALAIKYKDDYARAKVPMLPSVKGVAVTRQQILLYSLSLLPAVVSLPLGGQAGWVYSMISVPATLYFIYLAFRLWKSENEKLAMPLFIYSCFYLFFIFGALTIDHMVKTMLVFN